MNCFRGGTRAKDIKLKPSTIRKYPSSIGSKKAFIITKKIVIRYFVLIWTQFWKSVAETWRSARWRSRFISLFCYFCASWYLLMSHHKVSLTITHLWAAIEKGLQSFMITVTVYHLHVVYLKEVWLFISTIANCLKLAWHFLKPLNRVNC